MAKKPIAVEIRTYQVGFGDCFLLSFLYAGKERPRHVLIDFGTTGLPQAGGKDTKLKKSAHMETVANHIKGVCGKRGLDAVVATHRHADHISGFATDSAAGKSGEIIKGLTPRVVLQPWTEDPDAKKDARTATRDSSRSPKSFVASLSAMHQVAQAAFDLSRSPPPWMSTSLQRQLSFLGEDNLANLSAVKNLIAMGGRKGATAVWAHYGSKSGLERVLPGVKVHVLGPPNLKQTEKIRKMRSRDPDQFWHLVSGTPRLQAAGSGGSASSGKGAARTPPEARWFCNQLKKLSGQQVLEIVRTLDQQMNNTSLILLFEVFGMKLLFPGDAQLENWSYALEDAPEASQNRKLLAAVDVYKVGHHGSLNATPKRGLWENFAKRKDKKLHTLLSTMPGKHGTTASRTEVPRKALLQALEAESSLQNTDKLTLGKKLQLGHLLEFGPGRVTRAEPFLLEKT
jgi:beta-lactamase superfamily II metal-dependent hydrolase